MREGGKKLKRREKDEIWGWKMVRTREKEI